MSIGAISSIGAGVGNPADIYLLAAANAAQSEELSLVTALSSGTAIDTYA